MPRVPVSSPSWRERQRIADRVRALVGGSAPDDHEPADAGAPRRPARFRLDPGRRHAVAVGVVALVLAVATGAWVLWGRPHSTLVSAQTSSAVAGPSLDAKVSGSAPAGSSLAAGVPSAGGSARASPSPLVVDVVGRVYHPGICRLTTGARVVDAVTAAGGPLPGVDLSTLNLARKVVDGEQIAVGVAGAVTSTSGGSAAAGGASGGGVPAGGSGGGPVDLNAATAEQLDALPGVGPVLAQHILDWRSAHGRFDRVDQLREVSGIGPSKFATLRPLVVV